MNMKKNFWLESFKLGNTEKIANPKYNDEEFYQKWLASFASGISEGILKKRVLSSGNYLWQFFSFELLKKENFLEGDEARKVFDSMKKKRSLYLDGDTGYIEELPMDMDAASIDELLEIYVVSSDWSWTYIHTHEEDCGPYFYKVK